ncbi:MAG: PorV/PorQ family protein [Patescibacteria group bacterium]
MRTKILFILTLLVCLNLSALALVDPTTVGVGAKALSLGRAYVGYTDDGDTIFTNPAGLGRIDTLKLTSMQTQQSSDLNYLVLGGVYPISEGQAIGIGYASLGTGGIDLRDDNGTSLGSGNYSNSVYLLSYGINAKRILPFASDKLSLGTNLKYFSYVLNGSAQMEQGSGSGMDMDASLVYEAKPWLTLGYTQQNCLPSSLGGKISFANGYEEGLATVTKLGGKIQILGDKDESIQSSPYKLSLGLESDFYPTQNKAATMHVGSEFWPSEVLALRVGMDQNSSSDNTMVTNLSAGVGLRYAGFEFAYAYHPYSEFSDDTAHYISISYVGINKSDYSIVIKSPSDKLITKDHATKVEGIIIGKVGNLQSVNINGNIVTLKTDNSFSTNLPLISGKNSIRVQASKPDGTKDEKVVRVLRIQEFADVNEKTLAAKEIEYLGTLGLAEGYKDSTFKPDTILSRAELTTFLVRSTGLKTPTVYGNIFKDVPERHWANSYLKLAKRYELVEGYPDRTFKPSLSINRTEAAVIITRFDNEIAVPSRVTTAPYSDIKTSNWAAGAISKAKEAGMLKFANDNILNGKKGVNRAQFVFMLSKTCIGQQLIANLLDFNTGYDKPEIPIVYIPNKTKQASIQRLINNY